MSNSTIADSIDNAQDFTALFTAGDNITTDIPDFDQCVELFTNKYAELSVNLRDDEINIALSCEKIMKKLIERIVKKRLDTSSDEKKGMMSLEDALELLGPFVELPSDADEAACCNKGYAALQDDNLTIEQEEKRGRFLDGKSTFEFKKNYWTPYKYHEIVEKQFFLPYLGGKPKGDGDNIVTFGSDEATPLGFTITGPPGTGKTTIFREIARSFPHVRVYIIVPSFVKDSYVGGSAKKVEAIYNAANAIQLSRQELDFGDFRSALVLMFDEGDSIIDDGTNEDGSKSSGSDATATKDIAKTMQSMMSKFQKTVKTCLVANVVSKIPQAMQRRLQSNEAIVMGPPGNDELIRALLRQFGETRLHPSVQGTVLEAAFITNIIKLTKLVFSILSERYESIRNGNNQLILKGRDTLTFAEIGKVTSDLNIYFKNRMKGFIVCEVIATIDGKDQSAFNIKLSPACIAVCNNYKDETSSIKITAAPDEECLSSLPWFESEDPELIAILRAQKPLTEVKQVDEFISLHTDIVNAYNKLA